MPNAFEQEIAAGLADVRAAAGQTVTYTRPSTGSGGGPEISAELTAVRSRLAVAVETAGGEIVEYAEQWDFLVAAEDLVLGGLGEPAAGDRIECDGRVYEVAATAGDRPAAESDSGGSTLRIHTKRVPAD